MTIGYKINTSDYKYRTLQEVIENDKFVIDQETGEPKLEERALEVRMRVLLPMMVCNPQIVDDEQFDLLELGSIANKIELSSDFCILDSKEWERLSARVKKIQKKLNRKFYEMVRRVIEAEKVELEEKK